MAKAKAPKGQRIRNVKFNTGRITSKVKSAKNAAGRILAAELTQDLKDVLSIQGTRKLRSAPGEAPRRQKGKLQDATKVVFRKGQIVVKTTQIGIYLEGGTSIMDPRPFIDPVIRQNRRAWEKRFREILKEQSR